MALSEIFKIFVLALAGLAAAALLRVVLSKLWNSLRSLSSRRSTTEIFRR